MEFKNHFPINSAIELAFIEPYYVLVGSRHSIQIILITLSTDYNLTRWEWQTLAVGHQLSDFFSGTKSPCSLL